MEFQVVKGARTEGAAIITLEQAKANSKIDYDYEDALLQMYVDAIVDEFEGYTGSVILEREVSLYGSQWPTAKLVTGISPVQHISAVKYMDVDGVEQTLPTANYTVLKYDSGNGPKIVFNGELPEVEDDNDEAIEIQLVAGYATADMPSDIKKAALLSFSAVETFREDMPIKYNRTIYAVLQPYKKY
ncbi:head-tail connector protein [Patiriisocius marinus]|uniref:head-tail connector protein n=1 Tax=Patiriisocius marinus TaxID=1397112 RepID=UPI00232AF077|nr:phage head-tail connector protein [Patiriisocius marinus]